MFKQLKTAAMIAALTTAGAANAATDGSVGTSSEGTSDITVEIPKMVVVKKSAICQRLTGTAQAISRFQPTFALVAIPMAARIKYKSTVAAQVSVTPLLMAITNWRIQWHGVT